MDEYTRHQRIWHALYVMNSGWISRKFNMTHEDLHVDGPVLLVYVVVTQFANVI